MIKHKIGFFSELVSLKALKKANREIKNLPNDIPHKQKKDRKKQYKTNVTEWIYSTINDLKKTQMLINIHINSIYDVNLSVDYPYQIDIVRKIAERIPTIFTGYDKICQLYHEIKSS